MKETKFLLESKFLAESTEKREERKLVIVQGINADEYSTKKKSKKIKIFPEFSTTVIIKRIEKIWLTQIVPAPQGSKKSS